MTNFAEIFSAPDRMPGFWSGRLGTAYRYALGGALDQFVQIHWMRLRASLPAFATDASLAEIARDRRIPIFEGQSRASIEEQLRRWRSAHRQAGLPSGIMRQGVPLWLPYIPTIRVVAGNSQRAIWATIYGDDATATLDSATDDELNDGRTALLTTTEGKTVQVVVGRKPRFHTPLTSNWDWDSEYYADPMVSEVEPIRIDRFHVIVYAPPNVTFYGPDVPEAPDDSVGSSLTTQEAFNVGANARAWQRVGSALWGWLLVENPAAFSMTGSGAGYPDGTWWRATGRPYDPAPDRISFYDLTAPIGVP